MKVLRELVNAQDRVDEEYAEDMGFDAAMNGSNTTNCHFAIFSQPRFREAWERGYKRGKDSRDAANSEERKE